MTERRLSQRRRVWEGSQPGSDFLPLLRHAGTAPTPTGHGLPLPLHPLALQGSRKQSQEAASEGGGPTLSHSWRVQSEGKVGVQGRVVGVGAGQRVPRSWEGQWAGLKNLATSVDIEASRLKMLEFLGAAEPSPPPP